MMRTLFAAIFLIVYFVGGLIFLIPLALLHLFKLEGAASRYIEKLSRFYGRSILWAAGTDFEVRGAENFPDGVKNLCVISNHQSYADIPIILAGLPILVRFIAKKEVFAVPILGFWLLALESIPIDRGKGRSAIQAIEKGVESIKKGKPVVIFPEGTRSRHGGMGSFKHGSFKLALRSEAVILPVTIDGLYKLWEESHRVKAARVVFTIHKPVNLKELDEEGRQHLPEMIEHTIRSALA